MCYCQDIISKIIKTINRKQGRIATAGYSLFNREKLRQFHSRSGITHQSWSLVFVWFIGSKFCGIVVETWGVHWNIE